MIFDSLRARSKRTAEVAVTHPDACVSVVIPLFNHARYVTEAVGSALEQGSLLREVIVVDDGSTDEGLDVVRRIARTEPRLIVWSQPNRGAHAALNAGLHRATGTVLAILNSDDAYAPGRLAALAGALLATPGCDLAASAVACVDDAGASLPNPWLDQAVAFYQACGDLGRALVNGNLLLTTSNFVMRRTLLDAIGGFAPLRYAHDLDFILRTLAAGKAVHLLDQPLLRYRMHATNTIKEDHGRVRAEWAIVAAAYLARLGEAGDDWARVAALTDVLEQHRLTRAVALCLAYWRRHPSGSLEHAGLLADTAMLAVLRACVQ